MTEMLGQGISNIMQTYPGHTINHFFGFNPMMASQFLWLCSQLDYESRELEKQLKEKK